eukprot:5862653-Pyramimonas_sp.AAC.1
MDADTRYPPAHVKHYPSDPNSLPLDAKQFAYGDAVPEPWPLDNLQQVAKDFAYRKTHKGLRPAVDAGMAV